MSDSTHTPTLSAWELTPRDGLVLSDGRPFETGLATPQSLPLPHPQTLAGLVTTQWGLDDEGAFKYRGQPAPAKALRKQVRLRGPLLCERAEMGASPTLLVPAPLDCLWAEVSRGDEPSLEATAHRLTIAQALKSAHPHPTSLHQKLLVRPEPALGKGKPLGGPQFWRWDTLMAWLAGEPLARAQLKDNRASDPARFLSHLSATTRVHVSLQDNTRSALEGALFATQHTNYHSVEEPSDEHPQGVYRQQGVMFWVEEGEHSLRAQGVAHLGGDQRVSTLKRSALELPQLPQRVIDALRAQQGEAERVVRVTLLTPALFTEGATPSELLRVKGQVGVRHELLGWVTGRPQAISGWELADRQPKAHKRMAPAGSTYWLKLAEGINPVQWAQERFMTSISDEPSDAHAGFGLCVVGAM